MQHLWLCFLALFVASTALADDFNRRPSRSYDSQVYVYQYDESRQTYQRFGTITSPDIERPCFPHGCGGISGPLTNPNPDARQPENLTACIYTAAGILVYERENKVCPYKYVNENQFRVDRRRLEGLRQEGK